MRTCTCLLDLICVCVWMCASLMNVCVCVCVSENIKWCFPPELQQLVFNQPLHQRPTLWLQKLIRRKLERESKMWSVMSPRAEPARGREAPDVVVCGDHIYYAAICAFLQ